MSLRDHDLLATVDEDLKEMMLKELEAVCRILHTISAHLTSRHFEKHEEIDIRALIKTFEELYEISAERLIHTKIEREQNQ